MPKFVSFFPAHLSLLDGHYGYKSSMVEYNGVGFSSLNILLKIHPINRLCLISIYVLRNKLARKPLMGKGLAQRRSRG